PSSLPAGSGSTMVMLSGTNFISSSRVQVGSAILDSSTLTSTTISAVIPATLLTVPGTLSIAVFNPSPGGGTSPAVNFIVITVAPTITAITPQTGITGSTFIMALTGTNLNGATSAIFSGGGITATIGPSGTATSLSILVTIAANADPGARTLT